MVHLASVREQFSAKLWPLPATALVLALVTGALLPELDRRVDGSLPGWLDTLVFNGDAGAAQTVLDAVASSLITVTALTFSLTVVTLQLASSQYSPRLLRSFTRDMVVQRTLALFLATFIYSLSVLRLVRSEDDDANADVAFVPRMAVTLSFLLAAASVFVLVLFLAHLTQTIRVEPMLDRVRRETLATISATLPECGEARRDPGWQVPPTVAVATSGSSGFVVGVDGARLARAAAAADALVDVGVAPGDFVVDGAPVARCWPRAGHGWGDAGPDDLLEEVAAGISVDVERTPAQDVAFGLRQLTDVATRALSPSLNDPTTAGHAIEHLGAVLVALAGRDLGARTFTDADATEPTDATGTPGAPVARVRCAGADFDELLEVALGPPRRYGGGDPTVAATLRGVLLTLARRVPPELAPAVLRQLERLEADAVGRDLDAHDRAALERQSEEVRRLLPGST